MMTEPLDALLDKLTTGDAAAAEQVFRRYEPFLRMVVRRHLSPGLRAKFDSVDIVQSVWADLVRGFRQAGWRFASAVQLRAFLIRLTRDRFIDRFRQHRRAVECEEALTNNDLLIASDPRPSDVLRAEELWQEMLDLCPPEHREVLRLKRDGLRSPEIAARTGLHEGSVRRILCDLGRRLARRRRDTGLAGKERP
jgi:RNA polymerase sigma factor (sigma-70 family)